jgi:hypothetical protein
MRNTVILAASFAFSLGFSAAQASTFAEYEDTGSGPNLSWTQSPDGLSGTLSTTGDGASADVEFSFLNSSLSSLSNLPALFTFAATAPANDPAVAASGNLTESNLSGTFNFTYEGATPLTVGTHTYTTGANLLSGTFSGASLTGPQSGSTGSVQDSILSGGTVTYNSAFTGFSATGDKAFSLELTSVSPSYDATAGQSVNGFTAVSTGSFSADLVPEPASWALMILGCGLAGGTLRAANRRRSLLAD